MSMSRNLGAYSDIVGVLAAAVTAGEATFYLKTPGKALHWIQRAYYLRRLLHEKQGFSEYDGMKLTSKGKEVIIRFNVIEGVLKDKRGKVIETTAKKLEMEISAEDLEMMEVVKRDLGLETGGEEG